MNNDKVETISETNDKFVFGIIGALSVIVLSFLIWLIYFKSGVNPQESGWIGSLSSVNAFFNALTSVFLIIGYVHIKKNNIEWHKRFMYAATATSALFLVGYILYHHYHGDTKFVATGAIRPVYFFILISHILLSAVQVPLILSTLYLGITKKFIKHKKVAKITFPIWLYVSVTGVIVYFFLKFLNF